MPLLVHILACAAVATALASPKTAEELARLPMPQQLASFGDLPFYQKFKIWVAGTFMVTTDAIHIYIGFACFLVSALAFRIPATRWRVLLPGVLVSLGMEMMDLYYDYGSLGFFRAIASLHDLVNTNLIPLVLVIVLKAMDQSKTLSAKGQAFSTDAEQFLAGADPVSARSEARPSELEATSPRSEARRS